MAKGKKRGEKEKKARVINLLGELSSIVRSRKDHSQSFDVVKPTRDPSVVLYITVVLVQPGAAGFRLVWQEFCPILSVARAK